MVESRRDRCRELLLATICPQLEYIVDASYSREFRAPHLSKLLASRIRKCITDLQLGVPHLETVSSYSNGNGRKLDLQRRREGFFSYNLGKTEISYLCGQILVQQQDILWLDISVDYPSLVLFQSVEFNKCCLFGWTHKVSRRLEELNEKFSCLFFRELLLHHDPIEKLPFRSQFQDEVDAILFIICLLETQKAGMAYAH